MKTIRVKTDNGIKSVSVDSWLIKTKGRVTRATVWIDEIAYYVIRRDPKCTFFNIIGAAR